jgi:hypothetical protein
MPTYPTKQDKELIQAISEIKGEKEVTGFLRDILTPAEIEEFSRRFQIAKLLWTTTLSYVDIAQKIGTIQPRLPEFPSGYTKNHGMVMQWFSREFTVNLRGNNMLTY